MRKAGGGYTIVEVIIVLAISSILFLVAIGIFAGKNNSTLFAQAMQDLASKIQSYANQSTSGVSPDISGYNCNSSSGRPLFNSGNGDSSSCLFLGRALLASPAIDATTISAYSIVGTRDRYQGGTDTGELAQTFADANPTTARNASCPGCDLFLDQYSLNNSLQIVSSKISGQSGNYTLVGLYIDLGGTGAPDTSNSTGLLTMAYPFNGSGGNLSNDIQRCIEGGPGSCSNPINNFTQWQLCLQIGSDGPKAQLNINATASSLTTQINYQTCS